MHHQISLKSWAYELCVTLCLNVNFLGGKARLARSTRLCYLRLARSTNPYLWQGKRLGSYEPSRGRLWKTYSSISFNPLISWTLMQMQPVSAMTLGLAPG